MPHASDQVIQQYGSRILGFLIRRVGDFDQAEDLHQEVMLRALQNWRQHGLPANPLAWLFTTAKNITIDRQRVHRFEQTLFVQEDAELIGEPAGDLDALEKYLEDDLLRLIFTCCHTALDSNARIALTLRAVAGFSLEETARAFLVAPRAMEQRLVRAKRKIKAARIPYEIPGPQQIQDRLDSVLQTVYLIFNEGYASTSGHDLTRAELCNEAIHLGRALHKLFRGNAECMGLLALMLLQDSRHYARVSAKGELVLLHHQDRNLWDAMKIQEGTVLLQKALLTRQPPGSYQIQAAIAALHVEADTAAETDWKQITELYQTLKRYTPTPVVQLNYAVALMMVNELDHALAEMDEIESRLNHYFPFYCARAELQHRRRHPELSRRDYTAALALTHNDAEQQFIERMLALLTP